MKAAKRDIQRQTGRCFVASRLKACCHCRYTDPAPMAAERDDIELKSSLPHHCQEAQKPAAIVVARLRH